MYERGLITKVMLSKSMLPSLLQNLQTRNLHDIGDIFLYQTKSSKSGILVVNSSRLEEAIVIMEPLIKAITKKISSQIALTQA